MVEEVEKPRVYYTADTMLRYNPLWALVLGERSCGKSFEFRQRSINTPDSIWIYLRRRDTDRKDPKNWKTYLSDLFETQKIDIDAEYKVNSEGVWVDGIQKVIFSALSTDSGAHSMNYLPDSMQETVKNKTAKKCKKKNDEEEPIELDDDRYDRVIGDIQNAENTFDEPYKKIKKKIVFEEMIEPSGKYLKDEVTQLFEFYNTVDRYDDSQLFGLANLMSSYNPYFEFFDIRPFPEEFKWYKNKTLLVQNVKIPGMDNFVKSKRFYNLVDGTPYGDYLCNNSPWQDDYFFIQKKPRKARQLYNIRMHDKLYGVWTDDVLFYVSEKCNPERITFSGLKSMKPDDFPIKKNDNIHKLLNNHLKSGVLRFDSIPVRDMVYDIINGGFIEG